MKQNRGRKTVLYVALGIFLVGGVLFLIGYSRGGRLGIYMDGTTVRTAEGVFDRKTKKRVENPEGDIAYSRPKTELDPVTEFDIYLEDADLEIIPADGYYLQYELKDQETPDWSVEDGIFTFLQGKKRETSFDGKGVYFDGKGVYFWTGDEPLGWKEEKKTEWVKLYLPKEAVITRATVWEEDGNLTAGTIRIKDLDVNLGHGNVILDSWEGDMLDIYLKAGDFTVKDGLKAAGSCQVESAYGNFTAGALAAPEASVTLENGSMSLGRMEKDTLLTADVQYGVTIGLAGKLEDYNFLFETQNGEIQAPVAENQLIYRDDSTGRASVGRQDRGELPGKIHITSRQGKITVRENQ